MAPIVSTIDIECPPEEVFAYVTDPSRFPEWQLDVEKVRLDDTDPRGVGSRFTTTRRDRHRGVREDAGRLWPRMGAQRRSSHLLMISGAVA